MKVKNSVECWLYNKDTEKFLILQCPETERHKKCWQPVTGGIETGETPLEACIREVREESGLKIKTDDLNIVIDKIIFEIPEEDMELRRTIFIVYTTETEVILSDEHLSFKWESPENIYDKLLWNSNKTTFMKIKSLVQ
ncbi:MAG: NUDIX domain-containing protein [Desulfobacterales bacterium]|nr:NUDIX domain-containing protein [Desulfobacterales bacterium]MCP4158721.1 NUDIX domain-containing protein [Deltaproteobacteria bacterium]